MVQPARAWNEIAADPDPWVALHAGDYPRALNEFALCHMLGYRGSMSFHSDGYLNGFGVVLWLMGDEGGAANVWSWVVDEVYRGKIKYSSYGAFQGGLLLWFAAVWLGANDYQAEAENLLDKLLQRRQPPMGSEFACKLAQLLRGEIDLASIQSALSDVPQVREDEETMAFFYAGVLAFAAGDRAATRRLWEQAPTTTDRPAGFEHYLMAHELRRLAS